MNQPPPASRHFARVALAYTALLIVQVWHQPGSLAIRLFVTVACIWHSRALLVLMRPLTASEYESLEQEARRETRDPAADIYSAIGVAFWNWGAAVLASTLLVFGFGWGLAIGTYVAFVAISQFLIAAVFMAGLALYQFFGRVLRIGELARSVAPVSGTEIVAVTSPKRGNIVAAEHFQLTDTRPVVGLPPAIRSRPAENAAVQSQRFTRVVIPELAEAVTQGTIVRWLKNVGDSVDRGEALFEFSTDKVDLEFPSPAAGVLRSILVQEGKTVPIGTVVAVIDCVSNSHQ